MSELHNAQPDTERSAKSPLTAPVLFWTCSDASSLVAVVVSQFLAAQAQLQHQRLSVQQLAAQSVLGLAVHAIYESTQLTAALSGVLQTRRQHAQAFQLVFLQPDLFESRLALIEAGAHAVIHQISQVSDVLEKCLPSMKLSREGLHPITTGLVARLPWSFAE